MTVREDIEKRMAQLLEKELAGDFGARIIRFALIGAKQRMTKEHLDMEIEDDQPN